MKLKWISHACFKIKTSDGKVIYLDPYQIPKNEEKADIIVSSHSHHDHLDDSSINNVLKEDTLILGPKSISKKLDKYNSKAMKIGEILELNNISIQLVPAYTINKSTHPKNNEWAGIIVSSEGKSIYHAGDTERIPEMKHFHKDITVALLPCGGTYTMDFEEASEAALDIKPEILVPMHNWDKDLNDFKNLMNKKDPEIKVEILSDMILEI
ncbi:MAG: MBL fold metallo-hydrolase [Candidatus Lokiarchaeota archaeon]|nr:MBL fold metallo-hydrolase [Candidatus Lokiarchaeota archaeon]